MFPIQNKGSSSLRSPCVFSFNICYSKYKHSPSKDRLVHKVSFPSIKKGVQHLILWDFWFSSLPSIKILMKVITKFCLLELIRTLFFFFLSDNHKSLPMPFKPLISKYFPQFGGGKFYLKFAIKIIVKFSLNVYV